MGVGLAVTLAAVLPSLLAPATAAPKPAPSRRVLWDAPPGCPTQAELETELDNLRSDSTPADLRVYGVVTTSGTGYVLDLDIAFGDHVYPRRIQDEACAGLAQATAVVVALALVAPAPTPTPVIEPPQVVPPSADDAASPISVRPPAELAPVVAQPTAPPPLNLHARGFGEFAVLGRTGVTPKWGAGLAAGGGVSWARVRLHAGVLAFAPAAEPLRPGIPRESVEVSLLGFEARVCAQWRGHAVTVPLCAGPVGGALRARSRGFHEPGSTTAPWVGVTIGTGIERTLSGRTILTVGIDSLISLVQPRFRAADLPHPVFITEAVGAQIRLGLRFAAKRSRG